LPKASPISTAADCLIAFIAVSVSSSPNPLPQKSNGSKILLLPVNTNGACKDAPVPKHCMITERSLIRQWLSLGTAVLRGIQLFTDRLLTKTIPYLPLYLPLYSISILMLLDA
jgi:hypothetical protein